MTGACAQRIASARHDRFSETDDWYAFDVNVLQRLGWTWGGGGAEELRFWAVAQKMTLNREHDARLRQTVIQKLGDDAADYLIELDVA